MWIWITQACCGIFKSSCVRQVASKSCTYTRFLSWWWWSGISPACAAYSQTYLIWDGKPETWGAMWPLHSCWKCGSTPLQSVYKEEVHTKCRHALYINVGVALLVHWRVACLIASRTVLGSRLVTAVALMKAYLCPRGALGPCFSVGQLVTKTAGPINRRLVRSG